MAKPEWGQKRACPGCGLRFYDLMRDPITCPNCGATVDPSAFSKTRRSRSAAAKPVAVAAVKKMPEAENEKQEAVAVIADDSANANANANDNDKDVIEDASELGEDEDDVMEVAEGAEGKSAEDR